MGDSYEVECDLCGGYLYSVFRDKPPRRDRLTHRTEDCIAALGEKIKVLEAEVKGLRGVISKPGWRGTHG